MSQLIDDLGTYLQTNGIGTLGTDLFLDFMPQAPGTCVLIMESAGLQPDVYLPLREPGFQIFIRAADANSGRAKADAIRVLLQNLYMTFLVTNGTFIEKCNLVAEGGYLGRDDNGRDNFSLNFIATTR